LAQDIFAQSRCGHCLDCCRSLYLHNFTLAAKCRGSVAAVSPTSHRTRCVAALAQSDARHPNLIVWVVGSDQRRRRKALERAHLMVAEYRVNGNAMLVGLAIGLLTMCAEVTVPWAASFLDRCNYPKLTNRSSS